MALQFMVKPPKTLKPIWANVGVEVNYRTALYKLIRKMHDSVQYWLEASYRQNEPEIAQDAIPAAELKKAIRKLSRRWQRQFNDLAPDLARYFSTAVYKRSDKALETILKKGGMSVKFKLTAAMRDVLHATVNQNVNLIKSIPQKYLHEVEGLVMRSVQTGRDLHTLSKQLQKQYGVSKRRAALIARDQNNKASGSLQRVRQLELGITEAVWLHSSAGKKPRPTHVANNGKKYDIKKGWWDPAVKDFIHPGYLVNCRCTSKPIVPGFS